MMKKSILLLVVCILFSCIRKESALDNALRYAGNNRVELEKVLAYYEGDSLKYSAACFLIENMPDKYAILPEDSLTDEYVRILPKLMQDDPVSWELGRSLVGMAFDSIAKIQPEHNAKVIRDIDVITSDYLIENIDLAVEAWERSKIAKYYSFEDFCRYVLPYRVAHEPLSHWRKIALKRYGGLPDSLKSPQKAAQHITMCYQVRYNAGMTKYPYVLSYEEMGNVRWGTCDDMATYLTLSLRALGIPSATDFIKVWANRSSSHCWNVVKDTLGHFIDVGYGQNGTNPVVYKVSKVYRTQYDRIDDEDVTLEYDMPLSDLRFQLKEKSQSVYLCTFNNSQWIPIVHSHSANGKVIFRNMGRGLLWGENRIDGYREEGKGIVYLPAIPQRGMLTAITAPVILYEDGATHELSPDLSTRRTIALYRKYPKYNRTPSDVHDSNDILSGDTYELFYWNNEWCSLGKRLAQQDTLIFRDAPENALFWLHDHTQGKEERIFTYEGERQVWW